MPKVNAPAPIVLLDTSVSFTGPIVDFGGQEIRFVLVAETSADFALTDSNNPAQPGWVEALVPTALSQPYGFNVVSLVQPPIQLRFPSQVVIQNINPQFTTEALSYVLFQTQMREGAPNRIAAGSYKVTLYFV